MRSLLGLTVLMEAKKDMIRFFCECHSLAFRFFRNKFIKCSRWIIVVRITITRWIFPMVTTGPHLLVVIHVINNQSACAYSDDCSNASQVRLLYCYMHFTIFPHTKVKSKLLGSLQPASYDLCSSDGSPNITSFSKPL